jgi:hypothetical protein
MAGPGRTNGNWCVQRGEVRHMPRVIERKAVSGACPPVVSHNGKPAVSKFGHQGNQGVGHAALGPARPIRVSPTATVAGQVRRHDRKRLCQPWRDMTPCKMGLWVAV